MPDAIVVSKDEPIEMSISRTGNVQIGLGLYRPAHDFEIAIRRWLSGLTGPGGVTLLDLQVRAMKNCNRIIPVQLECIHSSDAASAGHDIMSVSWVSASNSQRPMFSGTVTLYHQGAHASLLALEGSYEALSASVSGFAVATTPLRAEVREIGRVLLNFLVSAIQASNLMVEPSSALKPALEAGGQRRPEELAGIC